MATKTIILRPTSVTSDNETLVTLYPTDTAMANAHILVSEEVADEDATYITSGLGSNVYYHFACAKPEDLKAVTGFSFKIRYRTEGTTSGTTYELNILSSTYSIASTGTTNNTAYVDVVDNLTDDIKSAIITDFNNGSSTWDFNIGQITAKGQSKHKPIRTTQIYIEITYEDNQEVVSYFKQDGTWLPLGGFIMYYKRNDKWNPINDSDLANYSNKKYLLEVIE